MRATAALLEQPGQPFVLTEVDLEDPRPDEVLVRVAAVGVCGTDLEFARFFPTPALLGHEGAGIVEKVGAQVTSVCPGDHVAMSFTSCGTCALCLTGSPAYCRSFDAVNFSGRRPDGSTAVTHGGLEVNAHFLGQSSFAGHVVAPERAVVRIDPSWDLLRAGPFGCGFQTGAGGVLNVLRPRPGSSIAVFGVGAVGVAAVIAASLSGCEVIAAVDVNTAKLEAARGFGATHCVDSSAEGTAGQLADLVPEGFDFVIDTTGREDVLRTAVEALGPLGHAGVIGVGPSETMSFDWRSILNGRTVTGIVAGSSLPRLFLPQLLELNARGRFPVEKMITYFPFEQINEAVAAVRSGSVGKAVLTF
ncbi:NAD(P)-dependent alcohol dehydrogenase [Streptomyces sp. NBC_01669]|uniref:NAD(P)-dependent alcohol dehydrogenase n=1 Tax=Streptomyces sp. NBC_01669 TaxID=2975909 RepID=UPI00224CF891|nr:NAD(P)-dependent alcohol dehydrogenase [Streptomyces sp. NBC_01669]MCX4538039.1 NAD(P)-dependent alcohol dehydrogenase [Streptomyces sp. NBC_01669]